MRLAAPVFRSFSMDNRHETKFCVPMLMECQGAQSNALTLQISFYAPVAVNVSVFMVDRPDLFLNLLFFCPICGFTVLPVIIVSIWMDRKLLQ